MLESSSPEDAGKFLDAQIENLITQNIKEHIKNNVIGLIVFAWMPAMIRVAWSNIISSLGVSLHKGFRADSVTQMLVFPSSNRDSAKQLGQVYLALRNSI